MKLKYKCEELARNYKNIGMKELGECYERLSRNRLRMYLSYFKIKHDYETALSLFEFIKNYENALPLFVYLEKDKLGKEVEGLKSKITEYEHIKNERDKLELVVKELESKITEYERIKKLSEEELRSKITEYEYVKNEKEKLGKEVEALKSKIAEYERAKKLVEARKELPQKPKHKKKKRK